MTGIALLGSTGSIGRQTLEVVVAQRDRFAVLGLAAGHASAGFEEQLAAWPAARAWAPGERPASVPVARWADGGLEELATADGVDLVVVATTGMSALAAVLAALRSGRRVALANKETLVTGGHLVTRCLVERGGDPLDALRPIDSEHSALWQCLLGEDLAAVARLVLTASGGPFRGRPAAELADVTPAQALAHPTWRMGPKITVDSATLVNKAFEAIEAKWLYGVPYSKIAAVIHPQSVVHSLVEFVDGSFKAQLGLPDMRLPIQFALTYPDRAPSPARHAAPADWPDLTFAALSAGDYPAYDAVRRAAEAGGNRGAVLNAADEVAVEAFLAGAIAFPRIGTLIDEAVERWGSDVEPTLEEIAALDAEVRTTLARQLGEGSA
ncbi:MAG TPA: 1-deoxy-D-xylulose-5-phosphate reductoisomerase [Candidatus Limnocylindria bacterium]|nr:1-deoxy-D-xylulose-5-phosphate reductoisomerase [Candidatus Limnocylindria bacterium]